MATESHPPLAPQDLSPDSNSDPISCKDKITLWHLNPGEQSTIHSLSSHLPRHLQQRLFSLGLTPHTTVICLRSTPLSGPKVYQIADSVFSLEKALALGVFCE